MRSLNERNAVITNAKEFAAFIKRIGYGQPLAFPGIVNSAGKIKPNTSMSNALPLNRMEDKNYIWKVWDGHIIIDVDNETIPPVLQQLIGKTLKVTTRAGHQFVCAVPEEYWERLNTPYTELDLDGVSVDTLTPILLQDEDKGYGRENLENQGRGGWGPGSFKINKKEEIEKDLPRNREYDVYDPDGFTHYIAEGDDNDPVLLPDDICEALIRAIEVQGRTGKSVKYKREDSEEIVKIKKLPPDKLIGDDNGGNHDILNNLELFCRSIGLDLDSSMEILWEGNHKCLKSPSSTDKLTELRKDYERERKQKKMEGQYRILRVNGGLDETTIVRKAIQSQQWTITENIRKGTLIIHSPFYKDFKGEKTEVTTDDAIVLIGNALHSGFKTFEGHYETKDGKIVPAIQNIKKNRSIVRDVVEELIFKHKEDPIYVDALTPLFDEAKQIMEECWDEKTKKLEDGGFKCKTALHEIVSFDPNPNLSVEYPKLADTYNEWAVYMTLYPGVYNTMEAYKKMLDPSYNPAPVFGAIAAFIGGEGCFKSTWIPALLRNLSLVRGQSYYAPMNLDNTEEKNTYILESNLYVEISEGRGLNTDIGQTKSFLGRTDDAIRRYFKDRPVFTPRRNGFYITSNNPNPFNATGDPQRRYAPFFVSQLPSLTEEAIREMPDNPSRYHNMKLDEWARKYARRIFAEMIVYYWTGRVPGLPASMEEERMKAYEHSDGSVTFEEDLIDVFRTLYDLKKNAKVTDEFNSEMRIETDWLKTNYEEIRYQLERAPYNYSRDTRRKDAKIYTDGMIKKIYVKITGEKSLPKDRYKYVKRFEHGFGIVKDRGVYFDLMHPNILELTGDLDGANPVKEMDAEDRGNYISEEVIQNEHLGKKILKEKRAVAWDVGCDDEEDDTKYFKDLPN